MLLQFSFGNFRSFRDKVTLDMTAVPRLHMNEELNPGNVVSTERNGDVLRVAAIYGANASGKSNIANALLDFRRNIAQSANTDFVYKTSAFSLDDFSSAKPTFFEIIFLLEQVQYRYGFELQTGETPKIVSEWLYEATSSRETELFERENNTVHRGRRFGEGANLLQDRLLLRGESLYLSLMAQNGFALSKKLSSYLSRNIHIISGLQDKGLHAYTTGCMKKGRFQNGLDQLIFHADTGISSLSLLDVELDEDFDFSEVVPEEDREKFKQFLSERKEIGTVHKMFDESRNEVGEVTFSLAKQESAGTRKLFAFAGPILDTLECGDFLFVDEMDARFHPNLTRALVRLFQSPEANPKNAQLIFVTHDTNLLDKRFNRFRRDQIWFVEKDRLGASHLYSLVELRGVRHTSEDEYISGTYGAIPFLGGMEKLINEGFSADAS